MRPEPSIPHGGPSLLRSLFGAPLDDALRGLDSTLRGARDLLPALLGLLAGWWLYVPLHELLHAAACAATGGGVSRLEIDPLYGGALLSRVLPFVVAGGSYAGRLSGFDTHGSDVVYLATDLGPFLLTLWPGVWGLRRAAAGGRALFFGLALPFAFAPFLSLTGDAYEIGSILVTRFPPWSAPASLGLVRGDDLFARASALAAAGSGAPWGGLALAAALGILWSFLTYGLGSAVAGALGRPPLPRP